MEVWGVGMRRNNQQSSVKYLAAAATSASVSISSKITRGIGIGVAWRKQQNKHGVSGASWHQRSWRGGKYQAAASGSNRKAGNGGIVAYQRNRRQRRNGISA